jgi:hypothetical protein
MSTNSRAVCRIAGLALTSAFLCLVAASSTSAQDAKSTAAAKQLSETLDRLKMDSIATADPSEPGTFVAALYFQGAQLLVVSAKYSAPQLLVDKLAKKDYRDVYIDLNAASVAGTKIFVMDQGADGLVARPGDNPPDSWEQGPKTTAFDGDWKKAKISEDEYTKAFAAADERYARILALLTEHAKKGGS